MIHRPLPQPHWASCRSQSRELTRLETLMPPADSPKMVTRPGSPPKKLMFFCTQERAASWSLKPQFPEACWSCVLRRKRSGENSWSNGYQWLPATQGVLRRVWERPERAEKISLKDSRTWHKLCTLKTNRHDYIFLQDDPGKPPSCVPSADQTQWIWDLKGSKSEPQNERCTGFCLAT